MQSVWLMASGLGELAEDACDLGCGTRHGNNVVSQGSGGAVQVNHRLTAGLTLLRARSAPELLFDTTMPHKLAEVP